MEKLKCNKKNMRRFVNALRSGDYSQARGFLRTDHGFCCLGVACELARPQVQGSWIQDYLNQWTFTVSATDSSRGSLPFAVSEWLGIGMDQNLTLVNPDTSCPNGIPGCSCVLDGTSLISPFDVLNMVNGISLNDSSGKNFDQIADAIEATYDLTEEGESL